MKDVLKRFFPPMLLLALLFTSLCSCVSVGETQKESGTGSPDSVTTGSSATSADPSQSSADLSALLTLIEEMEAEIVALKQENFILTVKGQTTEGGNSPADTEKGPDKDSDESNFTYVIENGMATVTHYNGKEQVVTVPDTLGGAPVRVIGRCAFADTDITEVVLPGTVTEIGWFAFSGCYSLISVKATGVMAVGYGAFDNCPRTLTLICPEGSYLANYGKSFGIAVKIS